MSVIAIRDLTEAGREVIANTFATLEIRFTVVAMYFLPAFTLSLFTLSLFTKVLERRFEVGK